MREALLTLMWVGVTIALGAYMVAHLLTETTKAFPF